MWRWAVENKALHGSPMNAVLVLLSDEDDNQYSPTTERNPFFFSFSFAFCQGQQISFAWNAYCQNPALIYITQPDHLPYKKMKICILNKWYAHTFPLRVQQSWITVTADIYRIIISTLETEQSHSCESKWLIYPPPSFCSHTNKVITGGFGWFLWGKKRWDWSPKTQTNSGLG